MRQQSTTSYMTDATELIQLANMSIAFKTDTPELWPQQRHDMSRGGVLTISSGNDATTRGVQTGPGAMQFTRMPLEIRWDDRPLVKVTMAPCTTFTSGSQQCHSVAEAFCKRVTDSMHTVHDSCERQRTA